MVRRVLVQGWSAKAAAAAFAVSEPTVYKWLRRYRAEGPAGLKNCLSRAKAVANRLAEPWIAMAERLRWDYR